MFVKRCQNFHELIFLLTNLIPEKFLRNELIKKLQHSHKLEKETPFEENRHLINIRALKSTSGFEAQNLSNSKVILLPIIAKTS